MIEEVEGYFTYRSFVNKPEGDPELFGSGEMFLELADDGTVAGTLAFPASPGATQKEIMDLSGSVTSWKPLALHFVGVGRPGSAIADFEYEYYCGVAHQWETAAPSQVLSLVGTVRRNKDHGESKAGVTASFIAIKREFVEPRIVSGAALLPEAIAMLSSRAHRLRHTVWHTLRGMWFDAAMTDNDRSEIEKLGWHLNDPPFRESGRLDFSNGAGEDFLYMHRRMIKMLHGVYSKAGAVPPQGWPEPPFPSAQFAYREELDASTPGRTIFVYDEARSGEMVPPPTAAWLGQLPANPFFAFNKKPRGLSVMQLMASRLRNPLVMASMTLGAYGNYVEFTVHNWMHMRWASLSRNPETGEEEVRDAFDLNPKWDNPEYDYLGDFHSSHVNPLFWRLHGWVDDCIDAWFAAQEYVRPGAVKRKVVRGVDWFEKGEWVVKNDPFDWPGAGNEGDHGHEHHGAENEVKTLEAVMRVLEVVSGRRSSGTLFATKVHGGTHIPTLARTILRVEQEGLGIP